jgi:hypothetical protein
MTPYALQKSVQTGKVNHTMRIYDSGSLDVLKAPPFHELWAESISSDVF